MTACDAVVREQGHGCCEACFDRDTHGLLRRELVGAEQMQQEIDNLHRLMAQMVLARGEHARVIVGLRNEVGGLIEQIALLRGDQERQDEGEKRRLMAEVVREVRTAVHDLPERLGVVERCIEGIEGRLKLRRKAVPGELPPPEADTPPVVPIKKAAPKPIVELDEDEPRRRLRLPWRRGDDEDDYGW